MCEGAERDEPTVGDGAGGDRHQEHQVDSTLNSQHFLFWKNSFFSLFSEKDEFQPFFNPF